jgi:hypothetical protein
MCLARRDSGLLQPPSIDTLHSSKPATASNRREMGNGESMDF